MESSEQMLEEQLQQEQEKQAQQENREPEVEDIRQLCALCKSMPCCPEHCCNWDSCRCSDCEYCLTNQSKQGPLAQVNTDPSILVKSSGKEEVKKVKKPKKEELRDEELDKPSEQIRTNDGALIINYEIPNEEEIILAGGIKGIRALRMQREVMNTQLTEFLEHEHHQNEESDKFSKYEESKR